MDTKKRREVVNLNTERARGYNDKSVLENFHAALLGKFQTDLIDCRWVTTGLGPNRPLGQP